MSTRNNEKVKTSLRNTIKKKKQKLIDELDEDNNDWKIEDFEIIEKMGRGKFGKVYAAIEKKSDFVVALKKMSKQ